MSSKYNCYEIVKVSSKQDHLQAIEGCEGVISGMSQSEETGEWGYAVSIYQEGGIVWCIMEEDLVPTGRMANPDDHLTATHVKVQVDLKTGEGKIVDIVDDDN